jgi:hypothetical protein
LVKFDISNSKLHAEGAKALAVALKDNNIIKELNISRNGLDRDYRKRYDISGVIAITDAIPTMGAMETFTFSGYASGYGEGPPVTIETSVTEADFSYRKLGHSGAIQLAAFLPKCQ